MDAVSAAVLEVAEAMEVPVAMQLWGPGGSLASSTSHVEMLAATFAPTAAGSTTCRSTRTTRTSWSGSPARSSHGEAGAVGHADWNAFS